MMALELAHRYAKALFNAAGQANEIDTVASDLALLSATLEQSPSLGVVLGHPRIAGAEKEKLLHTAFEGRVDELSLRFLVLVLKKGRQEVLPALESEYSKLVAQSRNQLTAHVRSAVRLTDAERKAVAEKLGAVTGKHVVIEEMLDPALIGGMVIRYGDKQLDGSIRHHLDQIRAGLKAARVALD